MLFLGAAVSTATTTVGPALRCARLATSAHVSAAIVVIAADAVVETAALMLCVWAVPGHWLAWQTLATPAAPVSVLLVTGLALITVGATAATWYGPLASAARQDAGG
jgi:hypothetical protein